MRVGPAIFGVRADMPYNTDQSGSTLTDAEMAAEAKRILTRIESTKGWQQQPGITATAVTFIEQKLTELNMFGEVGVTVKQLYWLRDSGEKID